VAVVDLTSNIVYKWGLMSAKEILIWPDPTLAKVSEPVEIFDDSVRALAQDLIDTMVYEGNAAGLSAPQIGVLKRVFIADIPKEKNDGNGTDGPEAFVNPVFVLKEGVLSWDEACLSIPDEYGPVKRAHHVIMKYQDLDGNHREVEGFDYLAGCLQHEFDHLEGKLWIDYQGPIKRNFVKKRMLKLKNALKENKKR
jgi:peptide deformylase